MIADPGWLLAHNRARAAGDGYASVEMTLWDDDRLVACATQMMVFSFPRRLAVAGADPPAALRVTSLVTNRRRD